MNYPTADCPTILEGRVYADRLRLESLDGDEMYLLPTETASWRGDHFHLLSYGPLFLNGKKWFVTHLQKQSKRGWLKTSPDCFHSWYWWHEQETYINVNGVTMWKPGTERGVYFRKPFSWRFDVPGTVIDGILRHWIRTRGYLGGHWD